MSKPATESGTTVGESYWVKYGMARVTLAQAMKQIEYNIKHRITRGVICLVSEAGEGKSQGIKALARKYKRRVVDIRTSQFSLIGAGVPQRANEETGQFKIAVPSDFPKKGEPCIMLFDEINQGQQHAIAMFFKLLEDRGIYDYVLPEDCIIVALMNPSTAAYNVSKIETNPAITRRLKKFYVYNTWHDWRAHAIQPGFHYGDGAAFENKPCHPWIVKFLETEPKLLYVAKDRDANKPFACPATWQTVSLDFWMLEAEGIKLDSEECMNRIAGTINPVMAETLTKYISQNALRISPEEVLTKYTPKSNLRARILEIQHEVSGEFPNLLESVAMYIFEAKMDTDKIAAQLLLFWEDMPDEQKVAFYSMLNSTAKAGETKNVNDNVTYMTRLTRSLMKYPGWPILNKNLRDIHKNFEHQLKGGTQPKDPMAT